MVNIEIPIIIIIIMYLLVVAPHQTPSNRRVSNLFYISCCPKASSQNEDITAKWNAKFSLELVFMIIAKPNLSSPNVQFPEPN